MAHDEELAAAETIRRPAHGLGAILDESGKAHRGIDPVIGNDYGVAAGRQGLRDEQVIALVARVPRAAIKEDHRLAVGARRVGPVEVELLARVGAVGDVGLERVALARHRGVQQRGGRAAAQQAHEAD